MWVQQQNLADAIAIFQRINQSGQRLSRFDLICANLWTEDFDFRKRVDLLNERFVQHGFGKLDGTVYTQTFALALKDNCTTAAELDLQTDQIRHAWSRVIRALDLAVDFATNNLGVKRAEYLPYRGVLAVLACFFYHAPTSALSTSQMEGLWNWFWRVTLSERYSSTSPSRMAADAQELRLMIDGRKPRFAFPSTVTAESVARTKMTSTGSALRNAFICMLALKRPKNLKNGSNVDMSDRFFSNLKKAERHHLFPVAYLRAEGHPISAVHLLPNFCFIPADLNSEIGDRSPAVYLRQYSESNKKFDEAAASHLLPVGPGAAVWRNDYHGLVLERAQLIAAELNRLLDSRAGLLSLPGAAPAPYADAERIDLLEIRLRDFIDDRFLAVVGYGYFRKKVPQDIKASVKTLIEEWQSRHPGADGSDFARGRRRLDFCDVSHYQKIILRNWAQFAEFFKRKDEFQRHMQGYRTIRNCIHHNRVPTDIEQHLGEAAITWLEQILDRYDREMLATARAGEDTEEMG